MNRPIKKIKVAIMSHEFDRRPERTLYFRRLIENLLKVDFIDLYLIHFEKMVDEPLYKRAHEILIPKINLPWGSRFVSFVYFCFITKEHFDIVHWLMPRIFPLFWLFPAKKVVVMAHGGGDVLIKDGIWTMARRIFNWTIILFQKHIDAFIAVSNYSNTEIIQAYKVSPDRVVTIYNPLDPFFLEKIDNKEKKIPYKYFLYLGRFRLHKNLGVLVRAYLKLKERNINVEEKLMLAGGTRKELEETFGVMPDSPFVNDIVFTGYVDKEDMPKLYSGATAFVFPSLNEGFGLPPLEAMSFGTPSVVSNATSLPEVVGDAGLMFEPNDDETLVDMLEKIATDTSFREELSKKGREQAKKFTWDKTLQKTIWLYRKVLSV